jgi:Gamma-glutamyltranspeptidase
MVLRSHWKANKAEVVAQHGVVTAMQPQAAEAGLALLKHGGNAVDAAVAMGFCNVVLEPYMAVSGTSRLCRSLSLSGGLGAYSGATARHALLGV